jgi:hypothetical protein
MMNIKFLLVQIILGFTLFLQCYSNPKEKTVQSNKSNPTFIADHSIANENVLRAIPQKYIDLARTTLHVAYQHTSHGTHVSRGLWGLQEYKNGDDVLFAVTDKSPEDGKLDFWDHAIAGYAPDGVDASDLSRNEKAFVQATRNFLDAPENKAINVVMWSWCNIAGHKVLENYIPGMDSLIAEYGIGGSKIGAAKGQRSTPVTFIFMTGHANQDNNVGDFNPKNQAELIIENCIKKNQYCLDYYNIDTHDMEGKYWEDAGDDGNSKAYGGNYYMDWQNANQVGNGWYENKTSPGGQATFGAHNTQHISANRKTYAMWWIMARIAGWNGK